MARLENLGVVALIAAFTSAVGCDDASLQRLSGELISDGMIEICGEDDPPCISAVNHQFPGCESQFENEWKLYWEADSKDEDPLLNDYMAKIYDCIVDEDGLPYFEFTP